MHAAQTQQHVNKNRLRVVETKTDCLIVTNEFIKQEGDLPYLVFDVGCSGFARPEAEYLIANPDKLQLHIDRVANEALERGWELHECRIIRLV